MAFWADFRRRFLHTITHKGTPLRLVHNAELSQGLALARTLRGKELPLPPEGTQAAIAKTPGPTPADDAVACFSHQGQPMPCLLPQDLDPADPWLTAPDYYPYYARVFAQRQAELGRPLRVLEVGVRTGYMGIVLARATQGQAHYTGIDPNLYLADGLARANASLQLVRQALPAFSYQLIVGYSTAEIFQDAMALNGSYDIIHIDGDHSLHGKVTDLWVARRLLAEGGLVLVDDYGHAESVAPSCTAAVKMGWFKTLEYLPTYRGCGVLVA